MIVDTACFHGSGDAVPRKESGCFGKPRGPVDPKSEVAIKRKTNPEMRKEMTNFILELFIVIERRIPCVSYHRRGRDFISILSQILTSFHDIKNDPAQRDRFIGSACQAPLEPFGVFRFNSCSIFLKLIFVYIV